MNFDNKKFEDYNEMYFYSIWSWTHLLFGFSFFIFMYKYLKLPSITILIILLVIHTIYEYKDYHITYNVYNKDINKINNGRTQLRKAVNEKKNILGLPPTGEFHMPPQSLSNSVGDTIFFMLGLVIAYLLKDKISQMLSKLIVMLTILYWVDVLISYIFVVDLGLHDKNYVAEHL